MFALTGWIDMAWTTTDLERIETAIASGALEVRFSDRSVRYQSMTDLLRARSEIIKVLDAAASTRPVRQIRVYSGKGIN